MHVGHAICASPWKLANVAAPKSRVDRYVAVVELLYTAQPENVIQWF